MFYNFSMSFEIELKAHVYNRDEVIKKMNCSGAEYLGHTEKSDVYYRFSVPGISSEGDGYITARIRKEILQKDGTESALNYFTYKRKKLVKGADGKEIEVNEENEFTFEGSANPMEVFFGDLGACISLKKEKKVEQWMFDIDGEAAHVELCTVPTLGDFLEIEIIKNENDEVTVNRCKKIEEKIFAMCNIPLEQIESRPYRELLQNGGK